MSYYIKLVTIAPIIIITFTNCNQILLSAIAFKALNNSLQYVFQTHFKMKFEKHTNEDEERVEKHWDLPSRLRLKMKEKQTEKREHMSPSLPYNHLA